jgi:hypothetical protein
MHWSNALVKRVLVECAGQMRWSNNSGQIGRQVIPEDWHMYFRCVYSDTGRVKVAARSDLLSTLSYNYLKSDEIKTRGASAASSRTRAAARCPRAARCIDFTAHRSDRLIMIKRIIILYNCIDFTAHRSDPPPCCVRHSSMMF